MPNFSPKIFAMGTPPLSIATIEENSIVESLI